MAWFRAYESMAPQMPLALLAMEEAPCQRALVPSELQPPRRLDCTRQGRL